MCFLYLIKNQDTSRMLSHESRYIAFLASFINANTNEFNALIQPLLNVQNPNIIINCEGLLYISSSGLRSLITLQKSVKQHNGQLVLEAMRAEIRKIFDMTGCSGLFIIR